MRIVSFRHKDLDRLWRRDEARGVARQHDAKLRAMLTALEEAESIVELETVPGWRLHPLKGGRKGVWSLTVTRNYRLTFRVQGSIISEIDFEDYH
jgi:proteic killer suppression protein